MNEKLQYYNVFFFFFFFFCQGLPSVELGLSVGREMQLSTREKTLSTSASAPKASFVTPLFHFHGCFRKVWQILLKILLILEKF